MLRPRVTERQLATNFPTYAILSPNSIDNALYIYVDFKISESLSHLLFMAGGWEIWGLMASA